MGEIETNFFEGKRPWSRLKDAVIKNYLPPYLKKVNRLNANIILIDSFAGPGKFENGESGSPIYICELAETYVPNNYLAILVNKNIQHHLKLSEHLSNYINDKKAIPIRGKAEDLLVKLREIISNQTVFLYLDPFGLKGTDFKMLEPFLSRSKSYSTELIINLSIPTILRLSCIKAFAEKGNTPEILSKHNSLTKVLGGDYWKKYLLNQELKTDQRIIKLLAEYQAKLAMHLPEVGYCPVYERMENVKMKYCIFFASRHPDAKLLMNDIMFNAYSKYIWERNYEDTFFGELNWSDNLPDSYFNELEVSILQSTTNIKRSREELWKTIVDENFMKSQHKHYNTRLKLLIKQGKLFFDDVKGTGKLNKDSLIYKKS
ncbi:MAG: three-Cys-motif partner protein TcmP [Ignavibacteria bacterium]|jgi:three-Cys-motif partner protein